MVSAQPAPQTLRRLMKEFDSIRAELDARRERRQQGRASSTSASRSDAGLTREGEANPDLLELRPWDADGEDLFEWYAVIKGPEQGNYSGEF